MGKDVGVGGHSIPAISRVRAAEAKEPGLLDRAKAYGRLLVRDGKLDDAVLRVFEHIGDSVLITEAEPFDEPGPRIVWANRAIVDETGYSQMQKSPTPLVVNSLTPYPYWPAGWAT